MKPVLFFPFPSLQHILSAVLNLETQSSYHLLKSMLPLLPLLPRSKLGLTELLELLLRRARCSDGSEGLSPLDRANRFRMSVNDTTPVSRPDRLAPGIAAAETEGTALNPWPCVGSMGDCGVDSTVVPEPTPLGLGTRMVAGCTGSSDGLLPLFPEVCC